MLKKMVGLYFSIRFLISEEKFEITKWNEGMEKQEGNTLARCFVFSFFSILNENRGFGGIALFVLFGIGTQFSEKTLTAQ